MSSYSATSSSQLAGWLQTSGARSLITTKVCMCLNVAAVDKPKIYTLHGVVERYTLGSYYVMNVLACTCHVEYPHGQATSN